MTLKPEDFQGSVDKLLTILQLNREELTSELLASDLIELLNAKSRPCGDCQECCFRMSITAFDKPVYTKCKHQCPVGCAIHSNPPEECSSYQCAWKIGWMPGDFEWRPDQLGVIFDLDQQGTTTVVRVWQSKPHQVRDEALIRFAAYHMAMPQNSPVFAYTEGKVEDVFLFPDRMRVIPNCTVYPLNLLEF